VNKEIAKKAFSEAEKELREKQIDGLKRAIKKTLVRIDDVDKEIKDLQEEKKILKLDIEDLKEGRLDRIEERQTKDEHAGNVSVVKIVKEQTINHNYNYDYWHTPYEVTWTTIPAFTSNTIFCGASGTSTGNDCSSFTIDSSTAKNYSIGTYQIGSKIVHLR